MRDYVVVTAVSSFRIRYVMHKDDLRNLNPGSNPSDADLIDWAMDSVTMMECEEFSQMHISENIIDVNTLTEDEMLELFDKDNDYLQGWDREKKIEWVRKGLHKDE